MSRKPSGRTASGRCKKLRVNEEDVALMDEVCAADGLNLSDEIRMLFRARAKKLRADASQREAARQRRRSVSQSPAPEEGDADRGGDRAGEAAEE